MTDRASRLKLGLFVALGLAGFAGLVMLFGGAPRLLSRRAAYTVTFPEAPGLGVGTPVRKSGVRVGEITKVNLDEDTGEVMISVEMDGEFRPRETDEATITRGFLSGDTTLDFVPRSEPGEVVSSSMRGPQLPPGTTITGVPPINTRTLLRGATDALPTAQENIARVMTTVTRFEQAVPRLERAADEIAGLARGGREFVPELRSTNLKVQELIGTSVQDEPPDPAAGPVTVRDALREIVELLRTIRPAADDLRALLRDNNPELKETLQSIRRTSDSINGVITPENRQAVSATLKNTQTASDDLVRTIRLAGLLVDRADKTVLELNARLAQTEATIAGVNRVVANAEKAIQPVAAAAPEVVANVQAATKNAAQATEQIQQVITNVKALLGQVTNQASGGGTVQRLLSDPGLYNNLNQTVVNVNQVIIRLDKVTRDLEVFADKVARRPESLGLGGIVRPNTGLKNPPTEPLPPTVGPTPLPPTTAMPQGGLAPIAPVTIYKPPGDLPPRNN